MRTQDCIEITHIGKPITWKRARLNGKRHFTPPVLAGHYEELRRCARLVMKDRQPHAGPIHLEMVFGVPIAKSWTKKKKRKAACGGLEPFETVQDYDNYSKAVGDALNKIVWDDDRRITRANIVTRYALIPFTKIKVYFR